MSFIGGQFSRFCNGSSYLRNERGMTAGLLHHTVFSPNERKMREDVSGMRIASLSGNVGCWFDYIGFFKRSSDVVELVVDERYQ